MKKISVLLLFIVVITYNALACNSWKSYGKTTEKKKYQVEKIDILDVEVKSDAARYDKYFSQAVSKPGIPIPVKDSKKPIKIGFWEKQTEVKDAFIIYSPRENTISFFENSDIENKKSYLLPLTILAIILLLISLMVAKRRSTKTYSFYLYLMSYTFFVFMLFYWAVVMFDVLTPLLFLLNTVVFTLSMYHIHDRREFTKTKYYKISNKIILVSMAIILLMLPIRGLI